MPLVWLLPSSSSRSAVLLRDIAVVVFLVELVGRRLQLAVVVKLVDLAVALLLVYFAVSLLLAARYVWR